jgi:glycosyltransferase involved in cell wall biosynthesis
MRLGFHYHVPACSADDGVLMPSFLGGFIDGLAQQTERVVCFLHSPRPSEIPMLNYRVKSRNVDLIDIGPHASVPVRQVFARRFTATLRARREDIDALLIRGPSPLLPAFAKAAGDKPTALLLVGSYVDGVDDLPQPLWRKELIRGWMHFNQWQQDRVAHRSLTFVNSRKLYERYQTRAPRLLETRTTTLSADDRYERPDTCAAMPIRLLYTGRYDRSKGLLEIIEALAILVAAGHDLVLDLVGWDDSGTCVIKDVMALAARLGVTGRVRDHGMKSVGPELFEFYRQADIYVIASRANEGFPRSIWEAMAHSVPVVATTVGSIPSFVSGAAQLVEPRSVQALAEGIQRVIVDGALRRGLISRGFSIARDNTMDKRCGEIVQGIRDVIDANHPSDGV